VPNRPRTGRRPVSQQGTSESRPPPPPPQLGARCGHCQRWLSPDHSCYRDTRLGVDLCVRCVGRVVEEKLGLVYVPKLYRGVPP
jgi:hypothetical protein